LLDRGENVLTFTPTETGKIIFTCSMGMYSGYFNVI
jgi:plastocyanin domain-containing protein